MDGQSVDQLLTEIEELRNKLHAIVGDDFLNQNATLQDENLLEVSKELDHLILKYMMKK